LCGIIGFISKDGHHLSSAHFEAARDKMQHRGPDDAGLWMNNDGRVTLGHRRLAVIDLSPAGHQPMVSPDGRYVIVFNGEIYNFHALRID